MISAQPLDLEDSVRDPVENDILGWSITVSIVITHDFIA